MRQYVGRADETVARMILLESGSDRAARREEYCRERGPRRPYNDRRVCTDGDKTVVPRGSRTQYEVVSFNLSTWMRELFSPHGWRLAIADVGTA